MRGRPLPGVVSTGSWGVGDTAGVTRHPTVPRVLLVVPVLALSVLLGGCSTVSTTTTTPTTPATSSSATPARVPDLQLRPVLGLVAAQAGDCPSPAPASPDPGSPAHLCSQDGLVVYSLGPAGVTGDRVTGLVATMTERTPQVQIRLDGEGGAALTRLTAEGMVATPPRNRLAIVSHGRVQSAPTITDSIDGGVLVITGFDSVDAAQKAVNFLVG